MKRIVWVALFIAVAISAAFAEDWKVIKIPLPFDKRDTTLFTSGALINDTIFDTTGIYQCKQNYTQVNGRILVKTADTCYEDDSIAYRVQTKFNTPYETTWWTVASADVQPAGTCAGTVSVISIPADSLNSIGEIWRVIYYRVAEEDTFRVHCDTTGGAKLLPVSGEYEIILNFRLK